MNRAKTAAAPRYHLRFQLVPGRRLDRDARELVEFCRRHGVEEAVLFIAAEEWNAGLLSKRDEDLWFATVRRAKAILDGAGLRVSLNPWMTALHCDRGRVFPKDRPFTPIESPAGRKSRACASFADPRWLDYVCSLYGRFARLGFRVLWVEDDFRYHNHAPLDWGGGFEPPVLKRFSRIIGRKVKRAELVHRILQPATPHPWRAQWMRTWRELQLEVARALSHAVAENSPSESRLGLMSSNPVVHGAEGRDWRALFAALSTGGRVAHRPHFAGYSEAPGSAKAHSIMMLELQKQFRPAGCEVAPEIENFPFTHWNKSDALTWAEMALCLFHGSDALLLDLFPFSGNSAASEPRIGELLDRGRPGLKWIAGRFPSTLACAGVGLPWKEDAQAHVRTRAGTSMSELNASPFGPGELLLSFGVPVVFTPQSVNAVFGSMAWAYSDDECREMLSGGLLLDSASASVFAERGFGALLGVRLNGFAGREDADYALEQATAMARGAPAGFRMNVNLHGSMARMEPARGAREWTTVMCASGRRFGAGLSLFRNRLGGRVAVFAAPEPQDLPKSYQRQALVHALVRELSGGRFPLPLAAGAPHVMPMAFEDASGRRRRMAALNGSPDPARPLLRIPGQATTPRATLLAPLEKPAAMRMESRKVPGAIEVRPERPMPYLSFLALEWD